MTEDTGSLIARLTAERDHARNIAAAQRNTATVYGAMHCRLPWESDDCYECPGCRARVGIIGPTHCPLCGEPKPLYGGDPVETLLSLPVSFVRKGESLVQLLERACATCEETGITYSAAWQEWLAEHPGALSPDEWSTAPAGPEEFRCIECDGRGTLPSDAGQAILDLVARYRDTR